MRDVFVQIAVSGFVAGLTRALTGVMTRVITVVLVFFVSSVSFVGRAASCHWLVCGVKTFASSARSTSNTAATNFSRRLSI